MKDSAGLLLYRRRSDAIEVFLVHPGGPFWAKKDEHAWSVPKGEIDPGEDPLLAAKREFAEETGLPAEEVTSGKAVALSPRKQSGKRIRLWAIPGDCDPDAVESNTFAMEWPPKSGRTAEFPEVDRAAWFDLAEARGKIHKGQRAFLDELEQRLTAGD